MIIQYRFECYEEGKYGLAIKTDNLALFAKLQKEINKTLNTTTQKDAVNDMSVYEFNNKNYSSIENEKLNSH